MEARYTHTTIDYADFGPVAIELFPDEPLAANVHLMVRETNPIDEIETEITIGE